MDGFTASLSPSPQASEDKGDNASSGDDDANEDEDVSSSSEDEMTASQWLAFFIIDEVNKLLTANFIWKVYCPDWLANIVLVKKANGKWRMCVDFTDLNKAGTKDIFPLLRIDQLVDSTAGHKLLIFMDTFSGYNQIKMSEEDQEKAAFIISHGLYCYKVMPFGLKNAGVTYQRLINKIFNK